MPTPAVRCKGLVKRYEDVIAVNGLDLEVMAGECFGLLGPNGAGKTTTVEIIQGIIQPNEGTVEVLGLQWASHADELRQRMGTALQETKLPDKLSVIETIRLFRSFYDKSVPEEDVLNQVQLQEKRDTWVNKLSGGQRQRLAVACALVCDPDILFLDEPTTGLDPQSRRQMWDVIERFKSGGGTVLLTTHYMEEAEQLCERVAVVDHGKVIALGSPRDLIASLEAEHVVDFAMAGQKPLEDAELTRLPGVKQVRREDGRVRLTVSRVHETIPALMSLLAARGAHLSELTTHHATLEDVFMSLTGRHLRDE